MNTTPAATHLTDADLVRHLDAEGDVAEQAIRAGHVHACAACAERVRALGERSERVRAWLVRADHEPRPAAPPRVEAVAARRRRDATPWLRAAIIVLLLATPVAAIPPMREWVAERIGVVRADDAAVATPESLTAPAASAAAGALRFTPAAGVFTVRVEPITDGTLVIGRAEGAEAVLLGAAGADPPVVSAEALRLTASPGRSYELRLPASVRTVRVLVDGRTLRLPAAVIDAGRVVDLDLQQ